jgi:predicted transposase YbfD/YdcC
MIDPLPTSPSLMTHFSSLEDPRVERTRKHSLNDMLVIAICGFICGVDNWVELEFFAKCKEPWFKKFLDLPNGIPSHDTFGRLFAALDPEAFSRCFMNWMEAVAERTEGEIVAIDGKTLRRSFDRAAKKAAIHMVSAWTTANGMVLGQVKTEEKSNEITAVPKLLELLRLEGCIVTMDAMGCQRELAQQVVDKGAHYVMGLKGNQGTLLKQVENLFLEAREESFETVPHAYTETLEQYTTAASSGGATGLRRRWTRSDEPRSGSA